MNILIDAVGCPMWGPLQPFLREAGAKVVGLDIDPYAFGLYSFDAGHLAPPYSHPGCSVKVWEILEREKINTVIPILQEGLLWWDTQRQRLIDASIRLLLSPQQTLKTCIDKWETYTHFKRHGFPTPETSLDHEYSLVKPRIGRGGAGIMTMPPGSCENMEGKISQEFLQGQEYSIDALCDLHGRIICVVLRKRLAVQSGISMIGQVVRDQEMEEQARNVLRSMHFIGPVNLQCFKTAAGNFFTEINPRLAGGMSLSMHATTNWFQLLPAIFSQDSIAELAVQYGMTMMRSFQDVVIPREKLLA